MLNKHCLSLVAASVVGLSATFNAQVLDPSALKKHTEYYQLHEQDSELRFIQFKSNNYISGRQFFQLYKSANANPTIDFDLRSEEHDALGYTHYRYQQKLGPFPVEGGDWVISEGPKGITFASGHLYNLQSTPSPTLTGAQAVQAALNHINADVYKWDVLEEEMFIKMQTGNPAASFFPSQDLVMMPDASGTSFTLCYKLDIYAHAPLSRQYVYVDASTGEVLSTVNRIHTANENGSGITLYNGTQNFTTDSHNGSFRLKQSLPVGGVTRHIHTHDMNRGTNYNNAVDFTDADNHFTDNTNQDRAGWSAHWGAEATWDYFFYKFGRNSYDGNGATINSYVHYDNNYNNAFWDGSRMTYGDGDGNTFTPLVGLDVVGHEITHAITERSSNLRYQNESGALNESFSDIFGTVIEFYKEGAQGDWLIGEDFDAQNGDGFRSMENPNAEGDPDTYGGTYWKSNSLFPNLADDYGGVHSNSGVQNFWFYILTVGKSGTNDNGDAYTVNGIGIDKAAAIAYRNNTTKLSQNSTHADARAGAIASAIELYGAGSVEEIETTNAWYAVGVGNAHPGGGSTCNAPAGLVANNVTQTSATLNWNAASSANAYNVRYKASSAGTWTSATTSSTSYAVSGLTAGTSYEFQVQSDCGSGSTSAYSSSATFSTSSAGGGGGAPTNYCASSGNNSSDEWIARAQIGSLDNNSGNNNGYGNYTTTIVPMQLGSTQALTLTPGFGGGGVFGSSTYPEYWKIWIDYNRDGDFADAGELAYDTGGTSNSAVSGSFTVPSNASVGQTRMRVQMKYNGGSTACENFSYGEVEDYTVDLQSATPPTCDAPTNLSSSNVDHESATLNWSAASNASAYDVQYRVSGGSWTTVSTTGTSYNLSGLSPSTSYQWRVKTDCGSTNSSYSSTQSFNTSAAPVCGDASGLSVGAVGETTASLSWSAGGNAQSYTLEYRVDGGSWSSVSVSGTSHTLSGLTDNTTYNWRVTTVCSFGNASAVNGANFTTEETVTPITYCNSQGNSTSDEWIQSVSIGSLSNNSGNNGGYNDFTSQVLNAQAGSSVSLTLTPGFSSGLFGQNSYPEYWRIWIDYNQDGDFTDAGELAFDAGGTSTSAVSGSFTVSGSALLGNTRMRVSMKYNGAPSPCETFSYGEVEDYTINISAGSAFASSANEGEQQVGELTTFLLDVFPNPASDFVRVQSDLNGTVKLYSLQGSLISEQNFNRTAQIQVADLAEGIYLLQITAGEKKLMRKVRVR